MRKNNIGVSNATLSQDNLQRYHQGGYGTENYAFLGFEKNLYFTSDRTIQCDATFNRKDGKPNKGYGLEIETSWKYSHNTDDLVAKNIVANIVKSSVYPVFPANLFKMQNDCTITGVEVISQVMTKEFIRNNYKSFKTMYNDLFPMFGMGCNGGCGMHVNLSVGLFGTTEKTRETAIRKLYYIVNKHYDFFKVAFHRINATDYCRQMDYSIAKTMDIHNMSSSHGNSFNGSHYDAGRVEIRLVGGQKDFACFRNTMEVVFHIVEAVKTLSWEDCDDLAKIFSGCNSYAYNRLKTNCYRNNVIDTATLEKIAPTVKEVTFL